MKKILILITVLWATQSFGLVCNAASVSQADVQTAVNSCKSTSGATVIVPAGSATWTTPVTISAPVGTTSAIWTLQGATTCTGTPASSCTDNTIITNGTSGDTGALNITNLDSSHVIRVTGFTWNATNTTDGIVQIYGATGSGTRAVGFRFDHNHLVVTGGRGMTPGFIWGLIDHNIFTRNGSFQELQIEGSNIDSDGGYTPWTFPMAAGTNNAIIVEDNTLIDSTGTDSGEDSIDCYVGASLTIRHNQFTNTHFGCHGTDSGDNFSMYLVEDYLNTFTNNTTHYRGATNRGGTALYWGNTFNGSQHSWDPFTLQIFRSTGPESNWQVCNGTNYSLGSTNFSSNASRVATAYTGPPDSTHVLWCSGDRDLVCTADSTCSAVGAGTCTTYFDGAGAGGYPCRNQPGRAGAGQKLAPVYAWLNVGVGGVTPPVIASSGPPPGLLTANIDYYNSTGSFTGATGVGTGLLAARPTTCTTTTEAGGGVAYWATDTNTLYQCSATNTWTTYYTPYVYPDPLQGGGGTVATPTFSPVAGTYSSPQTVTISTVTAGATLCYTTDGSTPTANGGGTCTHGTTYSGPVSVPSSLTLNAIGSLSGDSDSAVGTASYIISIPATPSPPKGLFAVVSKNKEINNEENIFSFYLSAEFSLRSESIR